MPNINQENFILKFDADDIRNKMNLIYKEPVELNWDFAEILTNKLNEDKENFREPKWRFDCGFKLDFDGPLLWVDSRFWPPYKNDGNYWYGVVNVFFLKYKIIEKKFQRDNLSQIIIDVEEFVSNYAAEIKSKLF